MRAAKVRLRVWAVAMGVLLGLGAGAAQAGTLVAASLQLVLVGFPPVAFTATGLTGMGTATGTGATAAWSVAAGAVPGGSTTPTLPSSAAPPLTAIQVIVNGNPGAGAFAASSPGSMAVTGAINAKFGGGLTLLGVPLAIGQAGTLTPPVVSGVAVTAYANAWTTKTTSIVLQTTGATAVTLMGSNGLAGGVGTVVLVTALNVVTNSFGQVPTFAILSLTYAPSLAEPAALALIASGAAGLVAALKRKR